MNNNNNKDVHINYNSIKDKLIETINNLICRNWDSHVQINYEERLPGNILQWCPPGRRKERPRNSWMQNVTTGMREKGIDRQGRMKKDKI